MKITRREFFKFSGSGLAAAGLGVSLAPVQAKAEGLPIRYAKQTPTICPYCAVGCGIIVHTVNGSVINAEGDPDHPINAGTLCPKGSSILQLRDNTARVTRPMYRAAGAKEWKEVEWEWALDQIAARVKKSRDTSFVRKNKEGQTVNRTDGIASVGSAALDNEECYLLQKLLRSWGLVYIEHQARI